MSSYDGKKPASDAPGMRGRPEPELAAGKQSLTAPPLHGHARVAPGKQTLVESIQAPGQRRHGGAPAEAAIRPSAMATDWAGWIQRVAGREPPGTDRDAARTGQVADRGGAEATPLGTDTYALPSIAQGTVTNPQGVAIGPPGDDVQEATAKRMKVRIVASSATKLRVEPGAVPSPEHLFIRTDDGAAAAVEQTQGTIEAPNTVSRIVEDCLFIDGAPQSSDIRQGSIADCYFMAVLLGIVNGDPSKLTSMMVSNRGQVTSKFFRYSKAQDIWIPQLITNSNTLQTQADGHLQGASFRIAPAPRESFWYAKVEDKTLKVFCEDNFEAAMWAPLLEKAYATFAQQFGQYGTEPPAPGTSGYNVINAGESQNCYKMFYGSAVADTGTTNVLFDPSASLGIVTQNEAAVTQLVKFCEAMRERGTAGGSQRFLQARVSPFGAAQRCKGLIQRVLDRVDANSMHWYSAITDPLGATEDAAHDALSRKSGARALADALRPLITAVVSFLGDQSTANSDAVASAARLIQNPLAHPVMWAPTAEPIYVELRENLGILVNLGSGGWPGRRTLVASHAYNVHDVTFVDRAGVAMAISSGNIGTLAAHIDAKRSTVTMENPYARSEWDERGTGAPDGANQGRFDVTLDQFLRNTDMLRRATVTHKRDGDDFKRDGGDLPEAAAGRSQVAR